MENVLATHTDEHGILHITFNRPEQLNALNRQLLDEFSILLTDAKYNDKVKALLITGSGDKAFCAGADIHSLKELDSQSGMEFSQHGQQILQQLEKLGKPSIAAINGYCFGGGCELAMACSLRIASDKAKFAQPEVKLGVIPCYSGTQRLARHVGKGRAIDLCLTGRTLSATEAFAWGLISEVTEPTSLQNRATEILLNILDMASLAITAILESIHSGFDMSLEEAEKYECLQFALLCNTEDKDIGVKAFLDKTPAEFIGR